MEASLLKKTPSVYAPTARLRNRFRIERRNACGDCRQQSDLDVHTSYSSPIGKREGKVDQSSPVDTILPSLFHNSQDGERLLSVCIARLVRRRDFRRFIRVNPRLVFSRNRIMAPLAYFFGGGWLSRSNSNNRWRTAMVYHTTGSPLAAIDHCRLSGLSPLRGFAHGTSTESRGLRPWLLTIAASRLACDYRRERGWRGSALLNEHSPLHSACLTPFRTLHDVRSHLAERSPLPHPRESAYIRGSPFPSALPRRTRAAESTRARVPPPGGCRRDGAPRRPRRPPV